MNISKIKKIWKNKWKILEGIWYNHFVLPFFYPYLRSQVWERRAKCRTCPFSDMKGQGENVILKGLPACGLCGCNIKEKTACLSCHCTLKDEGKTPYWDSICVSDKVEDHIEKKLG